MRMQGIYTIACQDKRQYVGSSANIERRWVHHRDDLRAGKHHSRFLQRAWNKYGADAFTFTVVEEVADHAQLNERERHWIETLKPVFNTLGVDRGIWRHSAASRKLMTEGQMRHWAWKRASGQDKHTAEHNARIAASHVGIRPGEATREKMSESAKRRVRLPKPARTHCIYGHPWTQENVYMTAGREFCLICKRERGAAWMRKRRTQQEVGV